MTRSPNIEAGLRPAALAALCESTPARKAALARALDGGLPLDMQQRLQAQAPVPGRPAQPVLVPHQQLKPRPVHTPAGRAVLLHALAHIEFNAINLACDILWRFSGLPEAFYRDWARVAREEALHFQLLAAHLAALGHAYGDFPAHNGLWDMAEKTQDDLLARLALVPRTLEARGLDAAPPIRAKLVAAGDLRAGEILDVILADEVGHVAIGNHWYGWLCKARGLEPVAAYAELARRYGAPRLRGPFNLDARRAAGFSEAELLALQQPDASLQ
ncbi:ferritin-like domain-containing protein [Pseudorhodoferax sp. LjRoot39]|uniref:ferritin-like domain-containing protein n=1 Tax=Pseudorhodoferax sp. LjRoot39 TaxID=3342328 RepID=UPI003F508C6C